jgi:hypothetical protein
MAIDTSIYAADLAEMIADEAHTVTINGTEYACSATDEGTGADLGVVGYEQTRRVTLTVLNSVLTSANIGQRATYNGRAYRVVDVGVGQDDVSQTITCEADGG